MDYSEIEALIKSDDSSDRRMAATMLSESGDETAIDNLIVLLKDTNSGVRDAAQSALMILGGKYAVEKLVPLVAVTDPSLRNAAIDILRKIGDDGIDVMHKLAVDENDDIRLFVLDILGTICNPESVDVLIDGLKDSNANVRNAAVVSLGLLGHPKAFEYLKPLIEDEEWIRFSAIEALSQIPHEETPGFLLEQLQRWSNDELTVSVLLETVGKIKPKKCIPALITMLDNASVNIEAELVKTLMKILSPEEIGELPEKDCRVVKSIIDMHLTDADDEILIDMLKVLSVIGDRSSVMSIVDLAKKTDFDTCPERIAAITECLSSINDLEAMIGLLDAEDKIKILASNVIGMMGKEEGALSLCERVLYSEGYVKRAMTDALSSIGGPLLSPTFKKLLTDEDGHVIASSLLALGKIGDPQDISVMEPYLQHKYPDVREVALVAMVQIGTSEVEDVFMNMVSHNDALKRILGLNGLERMSSQYLNKVVAELLKDSQWEVRSEAVKVIRSKDLPITTDMLKALLVDQHEQIRYAALDIVGLKKVDALRSYLEDAISGSDMWAASHAIEAIGMFKNEESKARLLELLTCGSDFLRISAIKTIGSWEDESLALELEPYLDDPNPDVARSIMDAIDRLQGVSF